MKKQVEHLGIKIKRIRAFRGMKQEELAARIGKTRSLISHFERTGNINKYTLAEIADILQVDVKELEKDESLPQNLTTSDKEEVFQNQNNCKETISRQEEEIRFLKSTIDHQWKLLHELARKG